MEVWDDTPVCLWHYEMVSTLPYHYYRQFSPSRSSKGSCYFCLYDEQSAKLRQMLHAQKHPNLCRRCHKHYHMLSPRGYCSKTCRFNY
jgi:hypothetical protein